MKIKIVILMACAVLASCVKMPTACYSADTADEILKLGQTVKFNADCSKFATHYLWSVDSVANSNVIKRLASHEGKEFTYTFTKKGSMRVSLTVVRKKRKGTSTSKTYQVK